MNLPESIPVGKLGWHKRALEIKVIRTVSISTVPQSGWRVLQKFRKKREFSVSGKEICEMMYNLSHRGYLLNVGFDDDRDSVYTLPL